MISSARTPALPEVPTMQELGYKDFAFDGWIGILAPAATPDAIVQRLWHEIEKAVAAPDVQQQLRNVALEPVSLSPQAYADMLVKASAKYQRIAQEAKIEKR